MSPFARFACLGVLLLAMVGGATLPTGPGDGASSTLAPQAALAGGSAPTPGVPAAAEAPPPVDTRDVVIAMLAAYRDGKVDSSEYYAATAADGPAHYAMAYLWAGRAWSRPDLIQEGLRVVRDLIGRGVKGQGWTGWGLGAPWDAFGDGTTNPADTVYTYQTTHAGLALLETHRSGQAPWALEAAVRAARAVVSRIGYNETDSGIAFRYSDNPSDRPYFVPNVSADAARFLLELRGATRDPRYDRLIAQAFRAALREQAADGQWPYIVGRPAGNGALHLGLTVEAMYACARRLRDPACDRAATQGLLALRAFIGPDGELTDPGGAVSWSLGQVLITLQVGCEARAAEACALRDAVLGRALTRDYRQGYFYERNLRSQGWIAAGLARVVAAEKSARP